MISAVMFMLWAILGVWVLITGHTFPWWWQVMMIFVVAFENLAFAIRDIRR